MSETGCGEESDSETEVNTVISGTGQDEVLVALVLCALWIPVSAWIGQEISGLVYTVEEVDLLRLEKHISVLEGGPGREPRWKQVT